MNSNDEVSELKLKLEKMEKYVKELEDNLKKYTKNDFFAIYPGHKSEI